MDITDQYLGTDEKHHHLETIQVVIFTMGEEEFAVELLKVQEIITYVEITPVPHVSDFVEGVINLRNSIIPIIDLRKKFSISGLEDKHTRIIIMKLRDQRTGFIVDGVSNVLRVHKNKISSAPPIQMSGLDPSAIIGVTTIGGVLMLVLNLENVFSAAEVNILSQVN